MQTRRAVRGLKVAAVSLVLASCLPPVDVGSEPVDVDDGIEHAYGDAGTEPDPKPMMQDGAGGRGPSPVAPDGMVTPTMVVEATPPSDAGGGGQTPNAALTLLSIEPAQGSSAVSIDAPLRLTFSADIDPVSAAQLTVELLRSNTVPLSGALSVEGASVQFVPSEPMILGNSYAWRIQGTLRSLYGAEWSSGAESAFQTRDGNWGTPQNLSTGGDGPRIAFDSAGNALAIWNQYRVSASGQSGLGVARFTPQAGWEALPPAGTCGPQCTPLFVAGGDPGVFGLSWFAVDYQHALPYRFDTGFGAAHDAQNRSGVTSATGWVQGGELWMASNLAATIDVDRSRDGSSWAGAAPWVSDERGSTAGPVLVVDGADQARVFWVENSKVLASTLSGGSWSAAQPVVDYLGDFTARGLSGAGVAGGNVVLAWEEDRFAQTEPDGSNSYLGLRVLAADGFVEEQDNSPRLPSDVRGTAASPMLARNARGETLLSWLVSSGDPNDASVSTLLFSGFHAATARNWSDANQLSDVFAGVARPPAVAMDPSGNGLVVWVADHQNGEADVLATRFLRETGLFQTAVPISAASDPIAGLTRGKRSGNDNCQLAVDARGRAFAIWAGADGGVWTQRFE